MTSESVTFDFLLSFHNLSEIIMPKCIYCPTKEQHCSLAEQVNSNNTSCRIMTVRGVALQW